MGEPDSIGHCFEPFVCFCFEPQVLNHTDYREALPGWRKRVDLPKGRVIRFSTSWNSASKSQSDAPRGAGVAEGQGVTRNASGRIFLAFAARQ